MNFKSKLVSVFGAGIIALSMVGGVAAQNSTTADVTLTVEAQNQGGLSIVQVQQSTQFTHVKSTFNSGGETNGGLTVEIKDERFTRAGWSLNISGTDFKGQRANNTMPVSQMTIQNIAVQKHEGDPAPPAAIQSASMSNQGVKIVSAAVGSGSGRYTVSMNTKVVVPANTTADTYKTVVTFTLDAAP